MSDSANGNDTLRAATLVPSMNRVRALPAFFAVVISTSACAQVAGYSDGPIRSPVFDSAKVVVETVAINNWLNANFSRLPAERHQGAREHIHALIDSRIKEIYARDKSILPKQPDPILPILFSWAGRLGVHAADATYEAVRGKYPVVPPAGPIPPRGLRIALDGELLKITSELGGWLAAVPYYFFIFAMSDAIGTDARRTQAVVCRNGYSARRRPARLLTGDARPVLFAESSFKRFCGSMVEAFRN
jgi:hypothetical protein